MTETRQVLLVGTGGTIAGVAPDPGRAHLYADSQLSIAEVAAGVPRPAGIGVQAAQLWNIGSEDLTEAHWRELYAFVAGELRRPDVAGIVVTHGTDTLEETAFFLSRVMDPAKPVVLTGAMRPNGALSSDVAMNIHHSIALAAHASARGKGVLVLMNERIYSPGDVAKGHTCASDSFTSVEWGPLGFMLGEAPQWARHALRPPALRMHDGFAHQALPRVDLVCGYAGIAPDTIDSAVANGARGIVYAGPGHGSIAAPLRPALARAVQRGCAVVRASRVPGGLVARNASESDDELGTIAAYAHAAAKSRVLLQLGLACGHAGASLQALFEGR